MKILALPKMNVMCFVLLNQFFWYHALGDAPDEIHLGVRCPQPQPRLKNEQRPAVQKKEPADQSHRHWHPCAARAEKGDDAYRDTRSHKDSDREIEECQ